MIFQFVINEIRCSRKEEFDSFQLVEQPLESTIDDNKAQFWSESDIYHLEKNKKIRSVRLLFENRLKFMIIYWFSNMKQAHGKI